MCGVQTGPACPGVLDLYESLYGEGRLGSRVPASPGADAGWGGGATPQPKARDSPSCTEAFMAPGKVQKAVPHAPSRRTKGHIDWFVGVFPGVLYISLPCCSNEEAESTEEGIGQHTSIRLGFLHLINQDFN